MKYLKNTATVVVDHSTCTGCGRCIEVCPRAVLALTHGKAKIVQRDRCIECGACRSNCAFHAIDVGAGVGCAAALIYARRTGEAPSCDCSDDNGGGCC
jgi:NAD-dependent dihydropyrimidine dehydrogenase PreA subunit